MSYYPGQGYHGQGHDQGGQGYQQGGYQGGQGYYPPQGPPSGYQQGGYDQRQGHGQQGYDQRQGGGYDQRQGGYDQRQGGYDQRQGYGQHQQGYDQRQGGGYDQRQGQQGYGGHQGGQHGQDGRYHAPNHAPPAGLDAYGYPIQQSNYASHARTGPPPPSAPQQFGHGAPDGYTFQYSNCTGRRKALLIGVNYLGQEAELRGCINDVHNVSNFLIERYNYKREDMVILTDDQTNPVMIPTKQNIIRAMGWLVKDARPNDALFLHYSGHGGQTEDVDGDEEDGYDEVIYPVDFQQNGHIVDDQIHDLVVRPLGQGVRLTAIFDSCHSASVMDLPYVYSTKGVLKEPNLAKEAGQGLLSAFTSYAAGDVAGAAGSIFGLAKSAFTGDKAYEKTKATRTSPADVIMWSGSKDDQTSADATINAKATGAMSWAFISAIKANPQQSYVELLNSVRDILETKYTQKPQLSSSHPLDTDLLFVM